MVTLYIDVFFLVNFVVDVLAAFFASRMLHIKTSSKRLIITGVVGGIFAIIDLLWSVTAVSKALNFISFFIIIAFLISKSCTYLRRIKYLLCFFICQLLIGGTVYYGYMLIDRYLDKLPGDVKPGGENRSVILFSIFILLAIGVFRVMLLLFSGAENRSNVKVRIEIEGRSIEAEALVDSGNLVRDPMSMAPVLFVKEELAKKILPSSIIELTALDSLSAGFRKRIRLIPVTRSGETHVMTGVRADRVTLIGETRTDDISVTVAIDKEEGSFGGYEALVPSSVLV